MQISATIGVDFKLKSVYFNENKVYLAISIKKERNESEKRKLFYLFNHKFFLFKETVAQEP
jgi:hypothetical protein